MRYSYVGFIILKNLIFKLFAIYHYTVNYQSIKMESPPDSKNSQKVYIPVGETALSYWHTMYPKLYEYQGLIGSITPENFDETMKLLMNDKDQIPIILCLAAESGNPKIVEIFSEYVTDISYINQARACAALKNHLDIVKFLTDKFQLKFSQATLYNAAQSCSIETIKYLCEYYPKEMTTYEIIESVLKIAMYKKSEFAIDILADLLRHTPQPQVEIMTVQNLLSNDPVIMRAIKESKKLHKRQCQEEQDALMKAALAKKIEEEQEKIREDFQKAMQKSQELNTSHSGQVPEDDEFDDALSESPSYDGYSDESSDDSLSD